MQSAIDGEEEEFSVLYYNGELIAKEEGFDEISDTFRHVRVSEQHHAKRYKELLENLKEKTLFKKNIKRRMDLPQMRICLYRI